MLFPVDFVRAISDSADRELAQKSSVLRHPEYYRLTFQLVLHYLQLFGLPDEHACCAALVAILYKRWRTGNPESIIVSVYRVKKELKRDLCKSVVIALRQLESIRILCVSPVEIKTKKLETKRRRVFRDGYSLAPNAAERILMMMKHGASRLAREIDIELQKEVVYQCPKHIPIHPKERDLYFKQSVPFMSAQRQGGKCLACQENLLEFCPHLMGCYFQCKNHVPADKLEYSAYMKSAAPYWQVWYWKMRCAKCGDLVKEVNGLHWAEEKDTGTLVEVSEKSPSLPTFGDASETEVDDEPEFDPITAVQEKFTRVLHLEKFIRILNVHLKTFEALFAGIETQPALSDCRHGQTKEIMLNPECTPFTYQTETVKKMMETGMGGICILPCGAGKTVVGILLLLANQRKTNGKKIIVCNSYQSIHQWRDLLLKWTSLVYDHKRIAIFHPKSSCYEVEHADVILVSYTLWTRTSLGAQNTDIRKHIRAASVEFVILDEVHLVSADTFSRAVVPDVANYGLTATFRSQEHQKQIQSILRAKTIHQVNVKQLVSSGHVADVNFNFVTCHRLYDETWPTISIKNQKFIYGLNPGLLVTALNLVRKHIQSKIMIISDFKLPIQVFKQIYRDRAPVFFVDGSIPMEIRKETYRRFEESSTGILMVTRVGDIALDIRSVRVAIQLSWQPGNVIQCLQRGGRLARRKSSGENIAHNYVLVNDDKDSLRYAQQFISSVRDYGYSVTCTRSDVESFEECRKHFREFVWKRMGTCIESYA